MSKSNILEFFKISKHVTPFATHLEGAETLYKAKANSSTKHKPKHSLANMGSPSENIV